MLNSPGVQHIGHRGSPREHRENTLPGFVAALEHGADGLELDVHLSADGQVVVHHDPAVAGLALASTPWSELAAVDLGGGARMPLLRDVLSAVGDRATVYIEIKGAGIETAVMAVAQAHGRQYAVHSFDHAAIARCASAFPLVPRGVLLDRSVEHPIEALHVAVRATRPRDVWPHCSLVDARFMEAAGRLGLRVIPWTVNSRTLAERLVAAGVAGICTDDVRLLANL
jgi:glycerophosphoryl diester phosphodiesterase